MTIPTGDPAAARLAEVWGRLDIVTDPELDESVTELGFVTGVELFEEGTVRVGFRLPTYWCAVNFAFLMADDMRAAVSSLPWVKGVEVTLGDHMYAEAINRGIAKSQRFEEAFPAEATQGLDPVRRTFAIKAFQRRQEALLRHLLQGGRSPDAVLALTMGALAVLPLDVEGRKLVDRYVWSRGVAGPATPDRPAFVDEQGSAVCEAELTAYLTRLRLVRVNMEANGAICRGLLAARFGSTGETAADATSPAGVARGKRGEKQSAGCMVEGRAP
jgi:metal-sulfur cluster biosynthetic enzyme